VSFDRLGLTPELLRAVADQGYTEPTPVQAAAIPLVLAGRDLLAGAQTGTGKTAAFVLPILQRLNASAPPSRDRGVTGRPPPAGRRGVRVLVLAPTRELALQVEESVRTYGARRPVRSVAIYGGVGFGPQAGALRAGAEVVVATPGRLLDHATQHTIDLSRVEVLVLDEADRMLDMGFIRDIRKILALLPARRQNLLFSATFSDEIRALAAGLLERPAEVDAAPRNTPAPLVRQLVHPVDRERKRELLSSLVRSRRLDQTLVFARTKHGANRLAEQLGRDGIATAAIHGNKAQAQRVRALADFRAGRVTVLVATDIAARGLDIDALPHVVNYELPMVPEDYVHRIGRTGRAGVEGEAISLVCIDEAPLLRGIEKLLGRRIPVEVVEGFAPDRAIPAEPIQLRSAANRRVSGGDGPRAARPPTGAPRAARPASAARSGVIGGPARGSRPVGIGRSAGLDHRAGIDHRAGSGRAAGREGGRAAHPAGRPGAARGRSHGPSPAGPIVLPGERFARRLPAGDATS
jgi:ATP-dependent RNA helicase RhlE